VYLVAGTSGETHGGTLDHPAMFLSLNVLGSVVIDLNGLDLEVKFLDSGGFIRDYFTIRKGVGPPEAPGGLTATAVSSSAISLSWTDNSTVESSYLIERSPDGAAWGLLVQLPAGSSSHVDGGLSELTTYHYRVLARNSLGDSSYSDVASATTAANPQVITFAPAADARVKASKRTRNYGTETVLRVELNEHVCYLKFTVSGVSGPVTAATLSLFNSDGSNDGGDLYAVSNSWGESTITWSNAPAIQGTPLASVGAVSTGERVDLDLTPLITGNGTYSFALRNSSTNSATYSSREGTAPPYLELKVGSGPPPPTTDFSASPRTGEAPLPVAFTDLSTGSPTSWLWTFGDGGSSTLKNPTYTYQTAGTYGVTLAATNAGGTGTVTKADFITVNPAPEPGGGGPVEHHESVGGGSVSSAEVATEVAVVAHPDELYLVAVATKPFVDVVAVQGLGVAWKTVRMQCGGRAQSGVAVFVNEGQPNVSEPVRATLASAASAATIVVSKYTGANPLNHFGNVISGNTNGLNGACAGGVDTSAYSFNLPVTAPGAAAYGAVSIRQRTHTPGATFTERMEVHAGLSGSTAGVAVMDKVFGEPTTATLSGTLSSSTDWAFIALEIVP
jgi:PKD repeat protein